MKQHYISGKRLSLWMRLVKRWKSLYNQVSQSSNATKLNKLNKLSLTLGIKRKIAVGSLAMMATLGTQAQVSFEKVEFGDNQVLTNLGISGAKPVFVDLDGDNDKDLVIGTNDGTGIHYFTNTNNVFTKQIGANNPFDGIGFSTSGSWINPTFADVDGDNDLDLVVGEGRFAKILYYKNDGNNIFTEQTGNNNPFSTIPAEANISLAFGDIDKDGDLDIVKGNRNGQIIYYKNTSNVFTEQSGQNFPFDQNDVGLISDPELVDVDGDNDLDLVLGTNHGGIRYFINDGTGNFKADQVGTTFEKVHLTAKNDSSPAFVDFDGDNDLDLVVGTQTGNLEYYENNNGIYEPDNAVNDIFTPQVRASWNSSPEFVDIDGDKDLDAIVGSGSGKIAFFKNNNGAYENQLDSLNPFNGIDVGSEATPTLADLDNDGDLDLVSGNEDGKFKYYEDSVGVFVERIGADNPLSGLNAGSYSSPTFVDLDGDGDLDLVSAEYNSKLHYYINNTIEFAKKAEVVTPNSGMFTEKFGADNLFNGLNLGYKPHPTFADLDNDGDLDLVVGEYYGNGTINYFSNDGDNNFTKEIGANNPFDGIDAGRYVDPTFADIDGDGDMDLVVGNGGKLVEYRNISVVGLSEIVFAKKESVTVYPNPVSTQLFVEKEGLYQISDATGIVILEGEVTSTGIDVSSFKSGVYVLSIQTEEEVFVQKLVKE